MGIIIFLLLFLAPGSTSPCPKPVTGPTGLVGVRGSCLYIPCSYDLCQGGLDAQVQRFRWLRDPSYDSQQKNFLGVMVANVPWTPGDRTGDCGLVLRSLRAAGTYGLRLETARRDKRLQWMHQVTVNLTDTPPAPNLWPDPAPLTQGYQTTFGCWVPPTCPEDTPTLTWEGAAAKTAGAKVSSWTPPDTVTPHPVIGIQLAFSPLWYHDGTTLSCILRDPKGATIARASRQLQVNYPPRDVRVEVTPSSPVREGQEVTLTCRDTAQPPSHSYSWSLGGQTLPHSTPQLRLAPAGAADSGSYTCRATNRAGTAESPPVTLYVLYPPRDVRVEVSPSSPVREGQEVTLTCRDAAQPPSHSYSWSLGGQALPHSTPQLRLAPAGAADSGSYACRATNTLGTSGASTTLEVYYPPRAAMLEALSPLPALAGTRVTLRCALGPAHPAPPTVQWLRDERGEAETAGPTLSFSADPARAGRYRCAAANAAGRTFSPPLLLSVWYAPRLVKVLQSPRGPVVAGGPPVRLSCQAGAAQPPELEVSWLKDGAELPGAAAQLVLPSPQRGDAAAYACQARNAAGVTRSPPLTLDVLFGPQEVQLVAEPGARVEELSDVTLRCRADAHPPPTQFGWFRGGRLLGRTPGGSWELRGVGVGAAGRYRCSVTNAVASAASPDVTISVYYSRATILRGTFLGLGGTLGALLATGTLGCCLRRRCRRRLTHAEPPVEPPRTFFLRHKKPLVPGAPRPHLGGDDGDTISYATLLPPGHGPAPRPRGDTVVYTVLKHSEGTPKGAEGPDYENVPSGEGAGEGEGHRDRDRDGDPGDGEGTLVYAALALSSPRPPRGRAGDNGDTVEYAALRH